HRFATSKQAELISRRTSLGTAGRVDERRPRHGGDGTLVELLIPRTRQGAGVGRYLFGWSKRLLSLRLPLGESSSWTTTARCSKYWRKSSAGWDMTSRPLPTASRQSHCSARPTLMPS